MTAKALGRREREREGGTRTLRVAGLGMFRHRKGQKGPSGPKFVRGHFDPSGPPPPFPVVKLCLLPFPPAFPSPSSYNWPYLVFRQTFRKKMAQNGSGGKRKQITEAEGERILRGRGGGEWMGQGKSTGTQTHGRRRRK